jgi:Protein of unknown function (DUF1517)
MLFLCVPSKLQCSSFASCVLHRQACSKLSDIYESFLARFSVALELLRQESSIFSGQANSKHFSTAALAEREFQRRSIESRSKFDRESGTYTADTIFLDGVQCNLRHFIL